MFYEPDKNDHGLRFNPFKALVVPRPIGWISTLAEDGTANLAPYSMFNAVATEPPCVMFASSLRADGSAKDSRHHAETSGEFVVNMATYEMREPMNASSAPLPRGESEFASAGIDWIASQLVKTPRVKASPVHLECVFLNSIELPCSREGEGNFVTFGRVVGVHIDDSLIVDGLVDICRAQPIARMGYMDYAVVESCFQMIAPSRGGQRFAAVVAGRTSGT